MLFKNTPTTSVLTTGGGVHAFNDDTANADTLIVDAGAFLITTGPGAQGALLANTKAWTVTVNGSIFCTSSGVGIGLDPGNPATSTITVGATGGVFGSSGIVASSAVIINNAGEIGGVAHGIAFLGPGPFKVSNSGTISGGTNAILDSALSTSTIVTSSGKIEGDVNLGEGKNKFTNSGTLLGDYKGTFGNDTVANSGSITGFVNLGNGTNALNNSGSVSIDVNGGMGNDTISNSGSVF